MAKIFDDGPACMDDEHRLPSWARKVPLPRGVSRSKAAKSTPEDTMNTGVPYLTPAETADLLRVSIRTVHRMLADGRLEAVRIGRLVRIRRSSVDGL